MATGIEVAKQFTEETGKLSESYAIQGVWRRLPEIVNENLSTEHTRKGGESSIITPDEASPGTRLLEKREIMPTPNIEGVTFKQDRMVSFQKREGVVLTVSNETFVARLFDPSHLQPDEEAEFYIEDLEEDDLVLLKPGAIFYWDIGYHDRPGGRIRYSLIKFRRLPIWTKNDIIDAERRTKEVLALFGDE